MKNQEWKNFHEYSLFGLLKSLRQKSDVVFEQLEIIGNLRLASHRWHQDYNFAIGHGGDAVRRLEIEVRLDQREPDALTLHLVHQVESMRRCGRNPRPRLDVTFNVKPEMFSKVRPGAMIGDHFSPAVWGHRCQPFLVGFSQTLFKVLLALLEVGGVAGIQFRKLAGNALGDATAIIGIEPV